jgi:hypothetical protein
VPHDAQSLLTTVPEHVPAVPHPAQPVQPSVAEHCAQVWCDGVPEHAAPVLKKCGGGATCAAAVAQQMRALPVQSLSD